MPGIGAVAKPILLGKDFNKFENVSVTAATFPSEPQFVINFKGQEGLLMVLKSGGPIEYSFNGNTIHGELEFGTDLSQVQFDHRRVSHIWFRTNGGSGVVAVHAWAAK